MREKSTLEKFVENKEFELAKAFIERQRGNVNYDYGESMVFTIMRCEDSPQDLIDTVLDVFLGIRQNYPRAHGSWVHSLSHFTEYLWQKGQFDWIKKFNDVAFKGALELKNSNCCDRLIIDFGRYAEWYQDPAEFHLTMDNLVWMDLGYYGEVKSRIKNSPFETEEAFKIWQCQGKLEVKKFDQWNDEYRWYLPDIDELRKTVQQLADLGQDVTPYADLEKEVIEDSLKKAEKELTSEYDDVRERAVKVVKYLKNMMTK